MLGPVWPSAQGDATQLYSLPPLSLFTKTDAALENGYLGRVSNKISEILYDLLIRIPRP